MIPFLVAAAVAAAPVATPGQCPDVLTAEAYQCKAMRAVRSGNSAEAAEMFEQGAGLAGAHEQAARMLAAAGNLRISAEQPDRAAADLDKALAMAGLDGPQRGEALLDRARAAAAKGDLPTARSRLTDAVSLIPEDPFLWYFSAAVAMREGNASVAQSSIAKALALAPTDPTILFEAGHVAHYAGDDVAARSYWQQAADRDPHGQSGKSAREALALLPAPLVIKEAPATAPKKN
jgi:tetratricopeptide (TPR) repeat protein